MDADYQLMQDDGDQSPSYKNAKATGVEMSSIGSNFGESVAGRCGATAGYKLCYTKLTLCATPALV